MAAALPQNRQSHAACSEATPKPGETVEGCFKVSGTERSYRLFVPSSYPGGDGQLPLVIGLHGGSDKAKSFERYTKFSELSESTDEFIAVYPKGIGGHWNDGREGGADGDELRRWRALADRLRLRLRSRRNFVLDERATGQPRQTQPTSRTTHRHRPSVDLWHKRNRCKGRIDSEGPIDRHKKRWGPKNNDHTRFFAAIDTSEPKE
ncbi:MAG: hypothetical protein CME06_10920 [Gemmatimonadetes bacterium]|nr:hypothetical protein [Gemmatimonadota bacterium]